MIGAGYTGLSAALEAAKRGASVAVLEAAEIGWGASSRNGGMVLSGLKLGPRELVARFGFQTARQMDATSVAAIDHVAAIVADEGIECSFARSGHLALASKASHYTEYQRDAEVLQQFGRDVRVIPKEALGGEVGSDAFFGALLDEASASLQPALYAAGLARAARRAGATICERAAVERVSAGNQTRGGFQLTTARGALSATDVILATGGYTGAAFPDLRKRV
ncbi:MAG TPA: FAD-dependent oxidoreductase, partial [Candidatus Eremiobacteraceae bacterium]|nr:FAD-dependent oxidoreductase [Candidatus Eremiobacteraceae bacterium]